MAWFFSGKGDEGKSSLMDGIRIPKNHAAFELIGTLDELNASLGLAISFSTNDKLSQDLCDLQKKVSGLMGVLAGQSKIAPGSENILPDFLNWIEERIYSYGEGKESPRQFVFPGKTSLGAALDLARTIARRAERRLADYREIDADVDKDIPAILNRLSSLFFLMRLVCDQLG